MTTMGVHAVSSTSALLPVGGQWLIEVETSDLDGVLVDGAPTMVVTLPDNTTSSPVFESVSAGRYRATYTVAAAGRYVAQVSTTDDVEGFAAYAAASTSASGFPDTNAVAAYLREGAASWDTEDLQDALDAEAAAQRAVCRVRAIYPDDLRQALLRRVQRNLAMRQLPLAIPQGDAEMGGGILPGRDPEVRRYEAPHRKLVVG